MTIDGKTWGKVRKNLPSETVYPAGTRWIALNRSNQRVGNAATQHEAVAALAKAIGIKERIEMVGRRPPPR